MQSGPVFHLTRTYTACMRGPGTYFFFFKYNPHVLDVCVSTEASGVKASIVRDKIQHVFPPVRMHPDTVLR